MIGKPLGAALGWLRGERASTLFVAAVLYGGLFVGPLQAARHGWGGGPGGSNAPSRPFAPLSFRGLSGIPREGASTTTPTATPTAIPTTTPFTTPTFTPTLTPTPTITPIPTPLPMPTPDGTVREANVPILMYHYIDEPGPDADVYRRDLSVSPQAFEEQMAYLSEAGYQAISLGDLILHLQTGRELPSRPVVLTFDDGYADSYQRACPILERYGFKGTFFVVTGFIDEKVEGHMTWEQVKELHSRGMEIGSHSYSHPDLQGRSADYIVWQILGSKEAIEERIGEPVRFFCYPSGKYDRTVVEILRQLDFWGATVLEQGVTHSSDRRFELRRIRVRGSYDLARFVYWLEEMER